MKTLKVVLAYISSCKIWLIALACANVLFIFFAWFAYPEEFYSLIWLMIPVSVGTSFIPLFILVKRHHKLQTVFHHFLTEPDEANEYALCEAAPISMHPFIHELGDNLRSRQAEIDNSGVQLADYESYIENWVVGIIVMAFRLWMPFHYIRTSLSDIDSAPEQKKDPVEQLNLLISRSADSTRINEALKRMLKDSVLSGLLLGKEKSEGPIAEEYDMCLTDATPLQPVFISSNRSEHLMSIVRPRCPHSECVSVPGEHTVLLLQPQDPALVMQLCAQIVQKNPRWYVVIGRTVESWGDLPAAYNEMSEAYRLRFLRPEGSSRCIGCLPALDGTTLLADQKSGQILEAVKAGKDEAVKAAYDEFLLLLNGKTYQSVVFALTHLAGDMLKLYYEYFPDTLPPRKVALKEFGDRLDEMNSLEEINGYFLSRFAQMTEKVRQDRKNRQGPLLDEVLRVIQSRYTDSDLSLQTLADAFHMSPAYLGRLFRQAQGQSVADCITGLRVEEAKRLLRETDIKIKDFGPMIGVENVQYFFVQFKQATGMTPKQYRVRSRRTDGRENQSP